MSHQDGVANRQLRQAGGVFYRYFLYPYKWNPVQSAEISSSPLLAFESELKLHSIMNVSTTGKLTDVPQHPLAWHYFQQTTKIKFPRASRVWITQWPDILQGLRIMAFCADSTATVLACLLPWDLQILSESQFNDFTDSILVWRIVGSDRFSRHHIFMWKHALRWNTAWLWKWTL